VAATILAAGVASSVVACGGSSSSGGGGASTATSSSGATSPAATSTGATATSTDPSTSAHTSSTSAGGGSGSSSAAGLKVFMSAGCGSCHTLAAAHATGDVGPNLDELKPSEARVAHQVTGGGAAMPSFAGRLSKAQIAAVAKFVASAAG
jgi:mono/diheme cytochrome c family protein